MNKKDPLAALLFLIFKEDRAKLPISYERRNAVLELVRAILSNKK